MDIGGVDNFIRADLIVEARELAANIDNATLCHYIAHIKQEHIATTTNGHFTQIAQMADNAKIELWYDFSAQQSQPLYWCGVRFDSLESLTRHLTRMTNSSAIDRIVGPIKLPLTAERLNCSLIEIPYPRENMIFLGSYFTSFSTEAAIAYLQNLFNDADQPAGFKEGDPIAFLGSRYERNPEARKDCIRRNGYACSICGINFEEYYGPIGKEYIHVHHLMPVSVLGADGITRKEDLVCVCPNCHAMLHRHKLRSPDEVRASIDKAKRKDTKS